MDTLLAHLSELDDPRQEGKTLYPLTDILLIAVCAAVAGAETYEDLVLYGHSKAEWLGRFLDLEHGIPSHDTFRRVFGLIDADAFETCFAAWATSRIGRARRGGRRHRWQDGAPLLRHRPGALAAAGSERVGQ